MLLYNCGESLDHVDDDVRGEVDELLDDPSDGSVRGRLREVLDAVEEGLKTT